MNEIEARRARVLGVARTSLNTFQFGQPGASYPPQAPAGNDCGLAAMQLLDRIVHPKQPKVTIRDVWEAMGRPDLSRRGAFFSEMFTAARALGLPYGYSRSLTAEEVIQVARHDGPVITVGKYPELPQWKGYRYHGEEADGEPNGYARPWGQAGANQLSGFTGAHYVVVLSSKWRPKIGRTDVWLRDPNHSSPVRPERPPFDVISAQQFERFYLSARQTTVDGTTWALIPSRSL